MCLGHSYLTSNTGGLSLPIYPLKGNTSAPSYPWKTVAALHTKQWRIKAEGYSRSCCCHHGRRQSEGCTMKKY